MKYEQERRTSRTEGDATGCSRTNVLKRVISMTYSFSDWQFSNFIMILCIVHERQNLHKWQLQRLFPTLGPEGPCMQSAL
jgi:hypothetical protein